MDLVELRKHLLPKTARLCTLIVLLFLVIHSGYMLLFAYFGVKLLFRFNIVSVTVYGACFCVLMKKRVNAPIGNILMITVIEMLLHMICAVIVLGWGYGFQVYVYGLPVFLMLDNYVVESNKRTGILTIIGVLSYILPKLDSVYGSTRTVLSEGVRSVFEVWNEASVLVFVVVCVVWLSRMIFDFEKNLVRTASYDRLTGLANRRYLDKLDYTEESCVAILDIDDFKKVNDTYGHDIGDDVLRHLADILRSYRVLQPVRWGGEEFLLIGKTDAEGKGDFFDIIDCVRSEVYDSVVATAAGVLKYHISVGVAYADEAGDWEELIEKADKRLYVAKRTGKNRTIAEG